MANISWCHTTFFLHSNLTEQEYISWNEKNNYYGNEKVVWNNEQCNIINEMKGKKEKRNSSNKKTKTFQKYGKQRAMGKKMI